MKDAGDLLCICIDYEVSEVDKERYHCCEVVSVRLYEVMSVKRELRQ
jgi:hypothetical protein